jgi:hypothetical protein
MERLSRATTVASAIPHRYLSTPVEHERQKRTVRRDLRMAREHRTIPLMRDSSAAARECPLAPPQHASVQSRALHRACLIVGGAEELAKRLEVSLPDIERWLRGEEPVPERAFLHAVEVVLLHAAGGPRN